VEAVTALGRTTQTFVFTSADRYLMRELERDPPEHDSACPLGSRRGIHVLAIVGAGRLGSALTAALGGLALELDDRAWEVIGPFGRGYDGEGADAVLLCVPDGEIAGAARLVAPGLLVGHCSGATKLDVLGPHEAFSLHPLLPVVPDQTDLQGAGAAIAGSSARALAFAQWLARTLGMRVVEIGEQDRAAYHAAASIASNFLITLEAAAERVAATAGLPRELLAPLVRATVENWAALGPERALTGPIARGDEATIAAQRSAIVERTPELVSLFDELVDATRNLAAHRSTRAPEAAAA
jgi:predicted short-subunit dehydrogenase-like oxidoreductase (DUF2520 family)